MENDDIDEKFLNDLNRSIQNDLSNVNSLRGFEIISESLVYKILDLFGRNTLLSMLYQTGSAPGEKITEIIRRKYDKNDFTIFEAISFLMNELKEFYSIQIREVEEYQDHLRIIIENFCFLRNPYSHREKLQPGKAFCRINKGYFETAFRKLLGDKLKKVEINFLYDDREKNVCVEEIVFYPNHETL
ncbi:MAG: hypothetical protein EAX91_01480 [Candidatus Lokiarchaeota archaeon]|nr:hypothetical protein [Candidatus Lokiarchaeota archaeon]